MQVDKETFKCLAEAFKFMTEIVSQAGLRMHEV